MPIYLGARCRVDRLIVRFAGVVLASAGVVGGACTSGGQPTAPTPDFDLSVSQGSLSAGQGSVSAPVSVTVNGQNGFAGAVSVTIAGVPAGVTGTPASPFTVAAGTSQVVTFAVSAVALAQNATLTFVGTIGNLSRTTSLSLTVTATAPAIQTYQQGSVVYLEARVGNETSRIGLETQWGGSIIEASWNGTNFVNHYDTGREVQAALYDGNANYAGCGCTGVLGWDPVQGGDRYVHGSPVLAQALAASSIYTKTQPNQWYPDNKGGGPTQAVPGDVFMEQTVASVPNHRRAFQLHYKITHFGTDNHADAVQEFPALYVNLGFDRFVYYGGTTPWTSGSLTTATFPPLGQPTPTLYESEHWGALVNGNDIGLAVYVPAQYPYGTGFTAAGGSGPTGFGTNYYHPYAFFAFGPSATLEGDIYLIVGDYRDARAAIYDLKNTLPSSDIFPPFGSVDAPVPNSQLSGAITVTGWAFDDAGVSKVEVLVDGAIAGSATYGTARPDVATVWPHAPTNCGYQFSLNTSGYANGPHTIAVRVTDASGNTAALPDVAVSILN